MKTKDEDDEKPTVATKCQAGWIIALLCLMLAGQFLSWIIEQLDREAANERRATNALIRSLGGR